MLPCKVFYPILILLHLQFKMLVLVDDMPLSILGWVWLALLPLAIIIFSRISVIAQALSIWRKVHRKTSKPNSLDEVSHIQYLVINIFPVLCQFA